MVTLDDPWLSAFVPEDPDAPLPAVGRHLHAVFACSQRQVRDAVAQGVTERVARAPAMAIELVAPPDAPPDVERDVDLQQVGAINDLAYGNADHGVERAFARLPASAVHAYGRRDRDAPRHQPDTGHHRFRSPRTSCAELRYPRFRRHL